MSSKLIVDTIEDSTGTYSLALGSGNSTFPGGIHIGGTGSANLLDDYEEGTWTPVVGGQSTTGTYETDVAHGSYIKIGNMVQVEFVVDTASSVTGGGSGYLVLTGLPFNYPSGEKEIGGSVRTTVSFTGSYFYAAHDSSGSSDSLAFYGHDNSGGSSLIQVSAWGANKYIRGSFTYQVA